MKLLQDLTNTGSRIIKEQRLKSVTQLELKVFEYALNPYKMYGISNFDFTVPYEGEPTEEMFKLLDKLVLKRLTGNAARLEIMKFAQLHGNLIQQICRKKLLCGVQAKTINRVHTGTIPVFNVQLAKELKSDELSNLNFDNMIAQIKFDGVRLIAIVNYLGKVELRTRNGKLVNCPELEDSFSLFRGQVFDGEIIAGDGKVIDRTNVSGRINSAIHGKALSMDGLTYALFDCMSLSDWKQGNCPLPYGTRVKTLGFNYSLMDRNYSIIMANSFPINSYEDLMSSYDKIIKLGYEGLILKSNNHKYTFKRSKDWIKLKEIKDVELYCMAIEEGKDKYDGMIGALSCEGTVEGVNVTVNVGTGLSDAQRAQNPLMYIGQKINVKYNGIIQDSKTGKYSLFLPRFVEIREDV